MYIQKQKAYKTIVRKNIEMLEQEKQCEIKVQKAVAEKDNKYSQFKLNEDTKELLFEQLTKMVAKQEIFLDASLTIEDLAKQLSTNRRYLSQVINEYTNKNFNNYINEFRIKKATRIILDPKYDYLSLEGIASFVGFNSKSSFNNFFKKYTGVTPSFFKKNHKQISSYAEA